jgi:glycosyltransferase involved in cell wall biosynthesis
VFRQLSGTALHENAGDFRLMSRRAVDAMNRLGERARFNKGLFAWIGFKSIGLPFEVGERRVGPVSRWRLRRLWHFAIDGIASFSTIPLRIWSYVGLVVSLFAFGYAAVFLVKTLLFGSDMAGFPTLLISILMLSGIQLISLGVIGEYLGRVFEEVKARPLFLIADEIGVRTPTHGETVSPEFAAGAASQPLDGIAPRH